MKLAINHQEDMPHLDREELTATITYDGATPARATVRSELASEVKAKEANVLVRQVKPVYGEAKAHVRAVIYDDDADIANIEQRYMVERNAVEETTAEADTETEPSDKQETASEASEGEEADESTEADDEKSE